MPRSGYRRQSVSRAVVRSAGNGRKKRLHGWVKPYTVQPLMLSVSVSRLRQGEEGAGEREDGVELGEYGENHGLGEDVVAVGHLVDTVAYEAGLLDG